ncbi:3-hydroxyacyl-CoA dehydrogenase [Hypericibacter adhaerens]|jgi:NAD(P)-dependent dehydrogenase (short-subunit alcohol dehydrogenase family)|uniref:3-hydroxyacyl-CoA dehydrogenase n=1 Tax=Hypericibacter adhaerens TaxID=2602016 RepID=A0A5J6MYP0_9PROT|nr:SDR family oxidoreductase [Hypericibacter adhaerens]QEX21400.1 3-hydroxyacyl-CoA dehydrogenase [Hypericibacter adhaerens]
MQIDYSGKAALITGAGRGLGLAIARALHASGARVAINDRTPEAVAAAIAKLGGGERLTPAPADLAQPGGPEAAVEQAVRAFGQLDLLVNNAAVNIERPIEATDDAHWDLHLNVVLRASFFAVKAAQPWLSSSKGSVINIASELGLHAIPNNVAYVTAKHGLVTMTRALALELARDGVRVNAVCPGTMDTELMRDCAEASPDPATYYRTFEAYHPLGRLASPEEIADFVLCVGSPAAGFMTGAALAIDGGSTAGRF